MTCVFDHGASKSAEVEVVDLQLVVQIESRELRKPQPQVPTGEFVGELKVGMRWRQCVDDRKEIEDSVEERRFRRPTAARLREHADTELEASPRLDARQPSGELRMRRVLGPTEVGDEQRPPCRTHEPKEPRKRYGGVG